MFDTIFHWSKRFQDRVNNKVPRAVMIAVGILMMYYAYITGRGYFDTFTENSFLGLRMLGSVLIGASGAYITFSSNRTFMNTVIIFSFSIGGYRAVVHYLALRPLIEKFAETMSFSSIFDAAQVVYHLVLLIFALLMFVTALAIVIGFQFRRNSLMYTCISMVAINMLTLTFMGYMLDWDFSGSTFVYQSVVELMLFLLVLWIFDSDEVRYHSTIGKNAWKMFYTRNAVSVERHSYILPDVAAAITDPERRQWRDVLDCGPVEKEYRFVIDSQNYNQSEVILQKWRGDDRLHLTMAGAISPTFIKAGRYMIDSIYNDTGKLVFAGKGGVRFSVEVRQWEPEDYFGIRRSD